MVTSDFQGERAFLLALLFLYLEMDGWNLPGLGAGVPCFLIGRWIGTAWLLCTSVFSLQSSGALSERAQPCTPSCR
jgi:hypothetical protein